MPASLQAVMNSTEPVSRLWSVSPSADMPCSTEAWTSSVGVASPSWREYVEWQVRWMVIDENCIRFKRKSPEVFFETLADFMGLLLPLAQSASWDIPSDRAKDRQCIAPTLPG